MMDPKEIFGEQLESTGDPSVSITMDAASLCKEVELGGQAEAHAHIDPRQNGSLAEGVPVEETDACRLAEMIEERLEREMGVALHDRVGQYLALARIRLGQLRTEVSASEALIREVLSLLDVAIAGTRDCIARVGLSEAREHGFIPALAHLAVRLERHYGLCVQLNLPSAELRLFRSQEAALFSFARELLVNVVKYANATVVNLTLMHVPDGACLIVEDDGVGFCSRSGLAGIQGEGSGLFSMRQRLAMLGGSMEVSACAGIGTRVSLIIPMKMANQECNSESECPDRR